VALELKEHSSNEASSKQVLCFFIGLIIFIILKMIFYFYYTLTILLYSYTLILLYSYTLILLYFYTLPATPAIDPAYEKNKEIN
jgi:ABC-type bacteriocin/lantibiotic exporter with double-glycine peptidase domain